MEEAIKIRPRKEFIKIRGANEHNLKGIDVDIPRNELVVLTGMSGSGKSSLAFDTIYAEGQRRYMESLSSYARMFLGQMEKPNVESIEGLSPAISIDQKSTNRNPRSTVGTVTEIYDYFRLLYARIGTPHCPKCGRVIMYADMITDSMREAIDETNRRREIQMKYNEANGITPQTIKKAVRELISITKAVPKEEMNFEKDPESMNRQELEKCIGDIQKKMKKAAADLDFETAAELRDKMIELKKKLQDMEE